MGLSTVTAARIFAGQQDGKLGEEHELSFETFPFTGLIKTYNVDAQVPDSAGTMTAMVTGVKTRFGVIALDEAIPRGSCEGLEHSKLMTLLELSELAGMRTGIVTTARITHATPAANFAKIAERDWEIIVKDASSNPECKDIAQQFVDFEATLEQRVSAVLGGADKSVAHGDLANTADSTVDATVEGVVDGIDVALGGGARHFVGVDVKGRRIDVAGGRKVKAKRKDNQNLPAQWQQQGDERFVVSDVAALDALFVQGPQKQINDRSQLLGLFASSHMDYEAQRQLETVGEQPSLTTMSMRALDLLEQSDAGFFLQIESGRIDHAHHAGNAYNALNETAEFSKAIQAVVDRVDLTETLILVTADHSHVMTIAGYPKRGNKILDYMNSLENIEPYVKTKDGQPYTTLSYANGRGAQFFEGNPDADASYAAPIATGRTALQIDPNDIGYHQEALVPLQAETHAGEDVAVYAIGPGAEWVSGTHEQNYLFHVMEAAAQLERRAAQRVFGQK